MVEKNCTEKRMNKKYETSSFIKTSNKKKGNVKMTKEQIIALKESRLRTLEGTEKNIKCGGVVRKLRREVRNLKK